MTGQIFINDAIESMFVLKGNVNYITLYRLDIEGGGPSQTFISLIFFCSIVHKGFIIVKMWFGREKKMKVLSFDDSLIDGFLIRIFVNKRRIIFFIFIPIVISLLLLIILLFIFNPYIFIKTVLLSFLTRDFYLFYYLLLL